MSFGGFGGSAFGGGGGYKSLSLPLTSIFRLAWEDEDLRARILFVLYMFGVFALGVHIPVPVPGLSESDVMSKLQNSQVFQLIDSFGGGALRRLSIFSLGMNPYITSSIIMQILSTAFPQMKKELEEGGEYARKKQNQRTRLLTIVMCIVQGFAYINMLKTGLGPEAIDGKAIATILICWTAGSMFTLWLGEQISERGIGNGVSLMIFAGIMIAMPYQGQKLIQGVKDGAVPIISVILLFAIFFATTWLVVHFTSAQRRIPVQHMRRMVGTKALGGKTSYLPFSLLMAGVLPIIFASAIIYMPQQFGSMFGGEATPPNPVGAAFMTLGNFISPAPSQPIFGINFSINPIGCLIYVGMIFFFSYFWNAIQYNVEDISNNLKRAGSIVPGVRPGKQTKDFLDDVISKLTIVGAGFIALIALLQYITPAVTKLSYQYGVGVVGGTSLLILVSVALETMRQIEANLLMKQYDQ
ncbi:MAG: preprotein translocase subunit SecY [Fimbriimonadales bacterium]|nr:preprotein translocase subunit SecY [Fimbriimonadales bacterium]